MFVLIVDTKDVRTSYLWSKWSSLLFNYFFISRVRGFLEISVGLAQDIKHLEKILNCIPLRIKNFMM